MIYLDEAATAKYNKDRDEPIIEAMNNAMRNMWMNPSSLYATNVKKEIDKCRENIAKFIGAKSEEIYFTSGASESNNMAIRGFVSNLYDEMIFDVDVITTKLEHKSIKRLVEECETLCATVTYCDVDKYGLIDLDKLEEILKTHWNTEKFLVSICMGNNEIGTIQPIKKISDLVHKYNGVLHCDCTQCFGHIQIDVDKLGIDMMSVSAHKISPVLRGIGFLYKKNGIEINPLIYGTQEMNLRGGTTNTYGIVGLNKAIELIDFDNNFEKNIDLISKRDYFINQLETKFGCRLNGERYRLPNNINVTFPQNITGEALSYMLDIGGIKCSTGSACNSKSVESSHVLKAIGLSDEDAMKTVRFTLPVDITYEEIDYVIKEIEKAIKLISV